MTDSPSVEDQELLADTYRRAETGLSARERRSEAASAIAFLLVVAVLWWMRPPPDFAALPAVLCLIVMVLATRVSFDTPFGFTVATQLGFVPLLFAVPGPMVPIAVVLAVILARLPDVLSGRTRPDRLLLSVGNSWFSLGPVLVFVLSDTRPEAASAGLLLAALAAQFLVDFTASGIRFWFDRGAGLGAQLRESWVYGIDAALSGIALVVGEELHRSTIAALAPIPLLAVLAMFARERHQRMSSLLELGSAYRGTALVLGSVVEADDGYTGEHCKSVVRLAVALGDELGLDPEQRRNLEFGALLHDVGKIAMPKSIINKPGKLDPHEWDIIATHTIEGQKMLDQVGGFMRTVGLIVRSHHERWDGSGYPDGLVGEDIPLEARIITCCDSWHAMRTDRVYRPALPYEEARAELLRHAGRQFDPELVPVFLKVIASELEANGASGGANSSSEPDLSSWGLPVGLGLPLTARPTRARRVWGRARKPTPDGVGVESSAVPLPALPADLPTGDDAAYRGGWLCPTKADRVRLTDMNPTVRRARLLAGLFCGIGVLVMAPWSGWYAVALFALAPIPLLTLDRYLAGSQRPERLVAASLTLHTTLILGGVAVTGGAHSPLLAWVVIPVVTAAARFRLPVFIAGAAVATAGLLIAVAAGSPGALGTSPAPVVGVIVLLAALVVAQQPLLNAEIRWRRDAVLDPLTGLLNRQGLQRRFEEVAEQARLTRSPVSIIVCDLDGFKQLNDEYGHARGDAALKEAAYLLRKTMRTFELLYRIGGEEMLLILPGAELSDAHQVAEQARAALEAGRPTGLPLTGSFGICTARGPEIEFASMFDVADRCLYEAKRAGRNRVVSPEPRTGRATGPEAELAVVGA